MVVNKMTSNESCAIEIKSIPIISESERDNVTIEDEKDKEERKQIRRERIRRNNATLSSDINTDHEKSSNETNSEYHPSKFKGKQQIVDSLSHLDKRKSNGILQITEIRIVTNKVEHLRRLKEEECRHQRMEAMKEEEENSKQMQEAVVNQWKIVEETKTTQGLQKEFENLRVKMNNALDSKNKLIEKFRHEVKLKDEDYVKNLNKNTADIEDLRARIKQELKRMEKAYRQEMSTIEDAFNVDREKLFDLHKKEIIKLLQKRKMVEEIWIHKQKERRQHFQKEVNDIQAKGDDEYNRLKIKLEKDIHKLEYQLEDVQATYQLNADKLEYNLQLVSEKDDENANVIKKQKKKFLKSKHDLSRAKEILAEEKTKNKRRLDVISFECGRIEKQYDMLQKQFIHFETADKKKFEAVKAMHKEEILALENQVADAGKLIEYHVLGRKTEELNSDLETRNVGDQTNFERNAFTGDINMTEDIEQNNFAETEFKEDPSK